MKAVVLSGNGVLRVEHRAPPTLGDGQCLVSIDASGVCSSDLARAFAGGAYAYPLIMGHEAAGHIVSCGRDVRGLRPGESVTIFPLLPCWACEACGRKAYPQCVTYDYYGSRRDGAYAECVAVAAWNLLPVPESVSAADAALTEPTAVVLHALGRLAPSSADAEIVVIGAGFLGQLAVALLARQYPRLRVTVLDRHAWKLERARSAGADVVRLADPAAWERYAGTQGGRFSLVLEAAGTPSAFSNSLALAARGGRVAWMGNISDDVTLSRTLVDHIVRREITVLGTWNSTYDGPRPSDWTAALALMSVGFSPAALVDRALGLDDLPEALTLLYNQKMRGAASEVLKVMVEPRRSR